MSSDRREGGYHYYCFEVAGRSLFAHCVGGHGKRTVNLIYDNAVLGILWKRFKRGKKRDASNNEMARARDVDSFWKAQYYYDVRFLLEFLVRRCFFWLPLLFSDDAYIYNP